MSYPELLLYGPFFRVLHNHWKFLQLFPVQLPDLAEKVPPFISLLPGKVVLASLEHDRGVVGLIVRLIKGRTEVYFQFLIVLWAAAFLRRLRSDCKGPIAQRVV